MRQVLSSGRFFSAADLVLMLEAAQRQGRYRGVMQLIGAMPLVAEASPAFFVSLQVADIQASWFSIAGGAMIAVMASRGRTDWQRLKEGGLSTILAGLVGFAAVYAMLVPLGPVFRRLTPTPERALAALVSAALYLPFSLAFELILRRGGLVSDATAFALRTAPAASTIASNQNRETEAKAHQYRRVAWVCRAEDEDPGGCSGVCWLISDAL